MTRPDALLLDEPFSALDVVTRRALQSQLLSLQALFRPTVIIATLDGGEAALLADRVVVLRPRPSRVSADLVVTARRPRRHRPRRLSRPRLAEKVVAAGLTPWVIAQVR